MPGRFYDGTSQRKPLPWLGVQGRNQCRNPCLNRNPTRTTTTGEPGLAFVSHGDCRWVALPQLDALDAGQVLLRLMAWQLAGQRGLLGDVYA